MFGAVLLAGLIDWTVQLPSLVRGLLLVGIVAGSGFVAYRYLIAPLASPVDNLSLALRVEEANPELNDALASTVQEVSDARSYDLLEALATAIADELLRRFGAERAVVRVTKPAVKPGGLDGTAGVSVSRP